MSQPATYSRSFSFTNYQALNPTATLPGSQVDLELNNAKTTLDQILNNLALIQRDDGAIKNASVGLDQLKAEITVGFNVPTVWLTGTYYSTASTVFNGSGFYRCLVAHTSGTFATDLAALKWQLIVNLAAVPLVAASQIAVTPSGNLTTDVQTSLVALDAAKAALSHTHLSTAISDITAAGRAMLVAANVAAQQTLLGLGALAYLNTIPVTAITAQLAFTGKIAGALVTNTNDFLPTGWATAAVVELNASTPINITGFSATTDGDLKILDNVGANNITFTSNDTASAAANRIALPRPMVLRPGQTALFKYDAANTVWRLQAPLGTNPVAGGFKNLIIGNVAGPQSFAAPTTPNTQYKCVADALTLEDANGESWRLTNVSVMGDLGAAGANGLDASTIAINTGYFFWVIGNPTTGVAAALWSTSSTAPTMPAGYTFKARVSWGRTNGSSQLARVLQQGRNAQYVVSASITTGMPSMLAASSSGSTTAPTWTAVSTVGFIPATASAIDVVLGIANTITTNSQSGMLAPNNLYGALNSSTNPPPISYSSGNDGAGVANIRSGASTRGRLSIESANIYAALASVNASNVFCAGWEDNI